MFHAYQMPSRQRRVHASKDLFEFIRSKYTLLTPLGVVCFFEPTA